MTNPRNSFVASRLAKRVARPLPEISTVYFEDTPTPDGLIDHLSEHLASGETHYTARPGIPELRASIGREVGAMGGTAHDVDGVIVTHGDGESLYVALLGLGLNRDSTLRVVGHCSHRRLLDLLGISVFDGNDVNPVKADASYREFAAEGVGASQGTGDSQPEIVSLDSLLFSGRSRTDSLKDLSSSTILIGNLDSVPGLDHFRLGFVAGPPDVVKRIQTWKQALSICTAGPSQRAALFAIERRPAQ